MKQLIRSLLVCSLLFTFTNCNIVHKHACPPTVFLQPCNSFTEKEAEKLAPVIEKEIYDNTGVPMTVVVLDNIKLSKDKYYNKERTRYRASKILNSLCFDYLLSHDGVIALMHDDISDSKGNIKDWGIQGLSYMSMKVSVASDFRVKDKSQFWKVVLHEFFHSFCCLDHCAKHDPTCLINEGAIRKSEKKLCNDCRSKLVIR